MTVSTSSPILGTPGAVPAPEDSPDIAVPWHYGDPFAEQRTATRSAVVVDRSDRTVLAVPGEERLKWLHLLLSQHVTELPDGRGTEALVLDGQGRVEAQMVLAHLDGTVWLDTEPSTTVTGALGKTTTSLLDYLEGMRFWSKVEPHDASADWALLSLLGPNTDAVLASVGVTVPGELFGVAAIAGGGFVRRMPGPGQYAVDLLVPRAELLGWWERLTDAGARRAGSFAFEALRVESLRPRHGLDTDDRSIPHELGLIPSAVHVNKGCYRGQETVAKVHNVGRPPRRLLLLHLDGSSEVLPEIGDPVTNGDRVVGRVGTVARHHELGPVALALIKRNVPIDAELAVGAEDRVVAGSIDPDSVPADTGEPPGRVAAQRLRG
ncbi:CAF17-like 4Fe-4S cluster assembly/insertion protein YgfZ [Actinoalloteichus hymeniacidonis]|uniref:Folate-binding protein n=1 Tax=Actinoalloteichus hymeniacidonis TaxID=340345 RepID=A0AAC9HVU9_9PSEU|nr:folate-binding protein [Actinoalloteichus hymeniacidonis]AOS65961.1 folate-binding protein [Actinoalloteichus hymeniacidonis]MBB5905942.1 hypothetical protein [Actinoalloteichus hymeniacidonis]